MIYPWQIKQWQQVWQSMQANRLPHALLLSGLAGTGKAVFAAHIAQTLLCPQVSSAGEPCNQCHHCRLVTTDVHPNVYQVVPEKEGQAIKVDQIRPLTEFVQQSSLNGEFRIVIIRPAHEMNMNAANALLKTLEEPSSGAIIILITDQSGQLPATIRSRCQRILFPRPDQQEALQWLRTQPAIENMTHEQALRLTQGSPLLATNLAHDEILSLRNDMFQGFRQLAEKRTDALALAAKWQKVDPLKWLEVCLAWVSDLLRLQLGAQTEQLLNQDHLVALKACVPLMPLNKNLQLLQTLIKLRGQMSAGINFNKQLLIENILIRWSEPVA